ncbi:MAG: helix-turn-helix transcriptional regulator [Synergistaceae bacterium]|nr:helix-turn-helix transcriptional regulator [Synergistaceae bacterium]
MENVRDEFAFFESLMKGIAALFGSKCEIVLHDLTGSYESTVVMIENGHVTGRKVGGCGSNLGLEVLRDTGRNGNKYGYHTNSRDGNLLRSSSIYIRNSKGEVIGCLCVNMDISGLMLAENAIKELTANNTPSEEEFFVNDVNELLDIFLQRAQETIGKPVAYMSREEKIRAIKYLDSKGALLISKAGNRICNFFNISKFTLYSYLDEAGG